MLRCSALGPSDPLVYVHDADNRHTCLETVVDSESPRPLSKIRSNFVAINKNGQLGLSLEANLPSTSTEAQKSLGANAESSTTSPPDVVEEPAKEVRNTAVAKPPSQPTTPPAKSEPPSSQHSVLADVSNSSSALANPTRGLIPEKTSTSAQDSAPAQESLVIALESQDTNSRSLKAEQRPTASRTPSRMTTRTPSRTPSRTPRAKISSDVNDHSAKTTKPETKHMSQTSRRRDIKSTTAAETKTKAIPPPQRSVQSRAGVDRTTPQERHTSKTPTKHVKIPTSVTAPTASSGARVDASRHRLPRQQNISQPSGATERSSSRASVSTKGTSRRPLKSSESVGNHPRPSVGPPPKKLEDRPKTTRESHVDQDFLARMMRPTQASSSKTSEKAPVTPPRKPSAQRPASSLAHVKPRSGSAAKSTPPSKKQAIEKPVTPDASTTVPNSFTETPQSTYATIDSPSQDVVIENQESGISDHGEVDAPPSETAQSLDGQTLTDEHPEPATVTRIEEESTDSPETSPLKPSNTDLSEAEPLPVPA